jgi:hypothetical protein
MSEAAKLRGYEGCDNASHRQKQPVDGEPLTARQASFGTRAAPLVGVKASRAGFRGAVRRCLTSALRRARGCSCRCGSLLGRLSRRAERVLFVSSVTGKFFLTSSSNPDETGTCRILPDPPLPLGVVPGLSPGLRKGGVQGERLVRVRNGQRARLPPALRFLLAHLALDEGPAAAEGVEEVRWRFLESLEKAERKLPSGHCNRRFAFRPRSTRCRSPRSQYGA